MFKMLKEKYETFVKEHLTSNFPEKYHSECYMCHELECDGCPYLNKKGDDYVGM